MGQPHSSSRGGYELVFIVLDGLDASGKSTQAVKLNQHLLSRGFSVHIRVHPSRDNWFGRQGRRFLLSKGKSAHLASAIFYIADVIRSILTTPWHGVHYIIYVRYLMGAAYLPFPLDRIMYKFFEILLPRPNIKLYFEIHPKVAYERIKKNRRREEMFESMEQLKKVEKKVKYLALIHNWIWINASQNEGKIEDDIMAIVRQSP